MAKVDAVIEAYRKVPGALLIALEKTQDITLYLPVDLQRYIASKIPDPPEPPRPQRPPHTWMIRCLLYTSDAADE